MNRYSDFSKFINLKISISAFALDLMEKEAACAKYTETGGVIAGVGSTESGQIIITHASPPGPNAKATKYFFQHDRDFCQKFLDDTAVKSNGRIDYLGEWHKHFESNPRPSGTDIRTMVNIAKNSDYHVNHPLLLIIGINNRNDSLRVFVTSKTGRLILTEWNEYKEKIWL